MPIEPYSGQDLLSPDKPATGQVKYWEEHFRFPDYQDLTQLCNPPGL